MSISRCDGLSFVSVFSTPIYNPRLVPRESLCGNTNTLPSRKLFPQVYPISTNVSMRNGVDPIYLYRDYPSSFKSSGKVSIHALSDTEPCKINKFVISSTKRLSSKVIRYSRKTNTESSSISPYDGKNQEENLEN